MFEELSSIAEIGALGIINLVILFKLLPRIDKLSDAINQLSNTFQSQIEMNHRQFQSIDNRLSHIDDRLLHIEQLFRNSPYHPPHFQSKYPVPPDGVS